VWCCGIKEPQPTVPFFDVLPSRLHFIYLFACSSASHFLVVCSPSVLFLPPQKKTIKCVPHCCFINIFSHSTTLLPNPCCAPFTLPLGSTPVTHPPCHTPNPFHPVPLVLPLPSTIIHAPTWCRERSPSTGPRAPCSLNGTNSVSSTTRSGLSSTHTPGGALWSRPDFTAPADLAAGDGPAVRDAFKRAMDARASWLACSAAFCAAILDSIG
jgi:hypothetical protein